MMTRNKSNFLYERTSVKGQKDQQSPLDIFLFPKINILLKG